MNHMDSFFSKYELLNSNNMPLIAGLGANSTVQLAINKKTEKIVAVKKIYQKQGFKEASIHSMLKHPNIALFIEFFNDEETNSSFIVLEYIPNGTLEELLNSNSALNEQKISQIFIGICKGLEAGHKAQIIHRDLKPVNIIFDEYWNGKICDFGSAVNSTKSEKICGTFEYMAPEILLGKQYDFKVDIWAIGIMMYELLERKLPFNEKNFELQLIRMQKPTCFENSASKNFVEIIKKMLSFNPEQRPQMSEVISFLKKIDNPSLKQEKLLSLNDENEQTHLKIFSSQNSTIDSKDEEEKNELENQKRNKEINLNKVISLKCFRSINQNKEIPKIIISKPLIKKPTNEKNCFKCISPMTSKISIKELIMRKEII